jgi:hypothetical protein
MLMRNIESGIQHQKTSQTIPKITPRCLWALSGSIQTFSTNSIFFFFFAGIRNRWQKGNGCL